MPIEETVAALLSSGGRVDPYPAYAELRGYGPLVPAGDGFYVAAGYAAVDAALREPRLLVHDRALLDRDAPGWDASRAVSSMMYSMLQTNPPDHARMRRLAAGVFTPRRVAGLQATVEDYAKELGDRLAEAGTADFMAEYAYQLPVRVICALLGVPAEDHAWFRDRAERLTVVLEPRHPDADLSSADAAAADLEDYFIGLVAERQRAPRDDLTSALIGTMSGRELLGNLVLLLVAGFETTTSLLGNALVVLLDHPAEADRLRTEPGLAGAFVAEALRFDSPVQITSRRTAEGLTVAGVALPEDSEVLLLLGAANRDPDRFEDPDAFRPDRADNQPISFGAGAHYCLGAALARQEAAVALPDLLRRFPRLALAGEPERRDRLVLRGYASLPVATAG